MQVIHARQPQISNNQSLTILPSATLEDGTKFVGWRIDNLKKINNDWTDGKGNIRHFYYTIESSIYDDTTQQILEKQQLHDNIAELQKMLAQSTASNAKSNVDVENLKKQNAMLTQQIAKMQVQNKKG